jgi:GNAT superfamily N-acetyltransferase
LATANDLPLGVLDLRHALEVARLSAQLGYPVAGELLEARLARLLASPTHVAFGAERGGRLPGWVAGETRFSLESDPRVEITGLVVDFAARRAGVGRLLVAGVEAWALRQGQHALFVRSNVVRPESHPF